MDTKRVECIYCHTEVDEAAVVPALDDDVAWEAEEEQHGDGCEWVASRAHRLDVWGPGVMYFDLPPEAGHP